MRIVLFSDFIHALSLALQTKAPGQRIHQCVRSFQGNMVPGTFPLSEDARLHHHVSTFVPRDHLLQRVLGQPVRGTHRLTTVHQATRLELWNFHQATAIEYGPGSNHLQHLLRQTQHHAHHAF